MIRLENERLKVLIRPTGGELQSIVGKDTGTEYLWQGDESIWTGRAPNLFPFVGRLFEKRYTLRGASYDMTIHGFAPKAEMAAEVATFPQKYGRVPHLVVILVGEDPASQVYVRNKAKACEVVGMKSTLMLLPALHRAPTPTVA